MLPNLSLNQLRTQARHLTDQLQGLAPGTPEYQAVRLQLQVNQTTIQAAQLQLHNLGNGLFF